MHRVTHARPTSGATIGTLTLRSVDPDHLRVRQRLDRVFTTVEWTPPGLSPHAILVVRRLVASAASRGGSSIARQMSLELQRCARLARRPHLDADAASADAVVFVDEAELVACLVRDWLSGLVIAHWWWRSLLGRASAEEWLRHHALPRGDVLAPAASLLAPRSDLVPWIARLPDADARVAAFAIARAFALTVTAPSSSVESPAEQGSDNDAAAPPSGSGASVRRSEAVARLIAIVPEVHAAPLGPVQRQLLACIGVALRAPAWGRGPAFAGALVALDRADVDREAPVTDALPSVVAMPVEHEQITDAVPPEVAHVPPSLDAALRPEPSVRDGQHPRPRQPVSMPPAQDETRQARVVSADGDPVKQRQERVGAQTETGHVAAVATREAMAEGEETIAAVVDNVEQVAAESRPADVQPAADEWSTIRASRIETEYGGLFYLLNAWLAMGLYADFTAPRGTNLAVSPWDLLARVGRAWFGDLFVRDPIWTTLASLALRGPEDEPGGDVEMPEGWLDEHLRSLTARLREALGAEEVSDISGLVCRSRAQIEITASCVHVHLPLSELRLDVRIAGLDRDPGWIPAAGRAVAFYFE